MINQMAWTFLALSIGTGVGGAFWWMAPSMFARIGLEDVWSRSKGTVTLLTMCFMFLFVTSLSAGQSRGSCWVTLHKYTPIYRSGKIAFLGQAKIQYLTGHEARAVASAARNGDYDTLKAYLDEGADPNLQSSDDGWTLLMDASAFGHARLVKLLLDYGADTEMREYKNRTALDIALERDKIETAELLHPEGLYTV